MSTLRSIGAVEGDRVVVEAGATCSEVLRATLAQGKIPPVLTEYLELSVADPAREQGREVPAPPHDATGGAGNTAQRTR